MGQVPIRDSDENLADRIDFIDEKSSSSSFANHNNVIDDVSDITVSKFRDPEVREGVFKNEIPERFNIPNLEKNVVLVSVTSPRKIGSGINAYVLYQVNTKPPPQVKQSDVVVVERRFRDFLALHENFVIDHKASGHLIPPPPEKNVVGMTLVKMTKAIDVSFSFIEKRRAALERYLKRIVRNPLLSKDVHLQEFLKQVELPSPERYASYAHSSKPVSMIEIVKNVQGALISRSNLNEEGGVWFQNKHQQLVKLSSQLHSLHDGFDNHFQSHKNVAESDYSLSESFFDLAGVEKQPVLSRIFAELSKALEKVSLVNETQANTDHYNVGEIFYDHLRITDEVNNLFDMRHKHWLKWQNSIAEVQKVKESLTAMQESGKTSKVSQHEEEADQLQLEEISKKQNYLKLSSVIKDDTMNYSVDLSYELRQSVMIFLNNMIRSHETNLKIWESFLRVVS